ncbi:globin [Luteolibacter flavescens]|uniref:Globin n=1 Tax=Luteolibacter flavescens TaxID=1859460 RepID=A0ABT3FKF3_9BACT|nr:globin [Luteolibacter flavescens]MCW1884037.1 globin [Luteolibacter flavescens]
MEEIVAREVGADGLAAMVAAFYRRVKTDDVLGPMYPEQDFEGAEKRLREFLQFRFLGHEAYVENRGHPRLRMRHFPFVIGEKEAARWVELMEAAMADCDISGEAWAVMSPFFAQVAEFLKNRP